MTDEQLRALLEVVDARIDYHRAAGRFDAALDTARALELSLRDIAGSAGIDHSTLSRIYLRRRNQPAKGA